jgi:sarcosine oxidase / L-pipecolate oxidase
VKPLITTHYRDSYAADEDFIISDHPNYNVLYFATGGSFYSWKFLPILGALVCNMIDGTLDEELRAQGA